MSLEAQIENLTAAVQKLTMTFESNVKMPAGKSEIANAPVPPIHAVVAPVIPTTLVSAATVTMPTPPFMTAPAVTATAPFSDNKGLVDYAMAQFGILGSEKCLKINDILLNLGYDNINNVSPSHYSAFYQAVEALKV